MSLQEVTEWDGMGSFMGREGDGTRRRQDQSATDGSRRGPVERRTGWSGRGLDEQRTGQGRDEERMGRRQNRDETEWSGPPHTFTGRTIMADLYV